MEGEGGNRANEFPAGSSIRCHGFRFPWDQNAPRRTGFRLRVGEEHGGIRDRQRLAPNKKKLMKIKSNLEEPANTNSTQLSPNRTRALKIEERGDFFSGKTVPMVRLRGKWLQAAGFPPGQRLTVKIVSPGVIEMRVCGKPAPTEAFHIAAMRLDRAIATAKARKAKEPA